MQAVRVSPALAGIDPLNWAHESSRQAVIPPAERASEPTTIMAHKKTVNFVEVEHKDDPVLCPKHGKKAQKKGDYLEPMPPDPPPNAANMNLYIGQAYCEECDDIFHWGYRAAS